MGLDQEKELILIIGGSFLGVLLVALMLMCYRMKEVEARLRSTPMDQVSQPIVSKDTRQVVHPPLLPYNQPLQSQHKSLRSMTPINLRSTYE